MITNGSLQNDLNSPNQARLRTLLRGFSLVLLLPILILLILVISTPLTISGVLYLLGGIALIIGGWSIVWGYRQLKWILWLGLALIALVAIVRLTLLNNVTRIKLLTLPDQNTLCLLNCLIDEQDAALVSTRVLPLIGWISPTEQEGLLDSMYAGYQSMAQEQSLVASPFIRTYLKLQNSAAFDAVIIESDANWLHSYPRTGVIFLHGFTGNFTMPCWLIAQAARARHALTVCPSVSWRGDWWTSNGEATLRATIDYLHQQGITRIYLAGLSNGAVGASELAYKLTNDIAGLILISGASPDAKDSGVPVLVLSGVHDERMPIEMMHAYAKQMGTNVTFVELQSDHFMLTKKVNEVQNIISTWLQWHPIMTLPE